MARKKKSFDDQTPDDQLTDRQYLEKYSKRSLPWDSSLLDDAPIEYTPGGHQTHVPFKKCLDTHPPIVIGPATIYGGSCSDPRIKTARVYVGLDYGAKTQAQWPWAVPARTFPVIDVFFQISDMQAPDKPSDFKAMVDWLCNQLHDGHPVHIGCIGGHGRTGMLITAIMATLWDHEWDANDPMLEGLTNLPDQHMLESRDFITWVRTHYCSKAVETANQITFLMHHYQTLTTAPSKTHHVAFKNHKPMPASKYKHLPKMDLTPANKYRSITGGTGDMYSSFQTQKSSSGAGKSLSRVVTPVPSNKNVWVAKKV